MGALCLLVVVAWGSWRGLDLSDEGLYLRRLAEPLRGSPLIRYEALLATLLGNFDPGVVGYRWIRLALTVGSSAALALSWSRWARLHRELSTRDVSRPAIAIPLVLIGSGMSYAIFPRTLSWNSLTLVLLQLWVAALLMALDALHRGRWPRVLALAAAASMLAGIQLVTRFPAGLLLLAAAPLWHVAALNRGVRAVADHAQLVASQTAGVLVAGGWLSVAGEPAWRWPAAVVHAQAGLKGYGVASLLVGYGKDLLRLGAAVSFNMADVLLLMFAVGRWGAKSRHHQALAWLATGYAFVRVMNLSVVGVRAELGAFLVAHTVLMAALLIAVIAADTAGFLSRFASADGRELGAVCIVLLLVPVIASVGTNNAFHVQMIQYVGPWLLAAAIMASCEPCGQGAGPSGGALVSALAVVMLLQSLSGYLERPYRAPGPLWTMTTQLPWAGVDRNLRVHAGTARTLNRARSLLQGTLFRRGDPMLVVGSITGLGYVLGASMPGDGWHVVEDPARSCKTMRRFVGDPERTVVVAPLDWHPAPQLLTCMRAAGLRPTEMQALGRVTHRGTQYVVSVAPTMNPKG